MDPVTLGVLTVGSMVATGAGGIMQASGQAEAGESANRMYQYRAGISQINSHIAEQNADYALKVGEVDAQREGMKTRGVVGALRAKGSASGIDVNTGSKARVGESAEMVGEQNAAVARADAAKRAYGHRVEAMNATAQGELYRVAGAEEERAGKIKAAGTLIGTAGSVASKWIGASQAFGGGGADVFSTEGTAAGYDPWEGMR